MKLSHTLLTVANVASFAAAWEPEAQDTENNILRGQEALDYLFKYNTSRPHPSDTLVVTLPDGNPTNLTLGYDQGYLMRVCKPRDFTGETGRDLRTNPSYPAGQPGTYEEMLWQFRFKYSSSDFPCERLRWIRAECGVMDRPGMIESNITIADQNKCLCEGDYWTANWGCDACFSKHHGNATLKAKDEKRSDEISSAMCAPGAEPTAYYDYLKSYSVQDLLPTSIVSDALPGKTHPNDYFPGAGSDLVPATIQEPSFVRTNLGVEVTMTPGPRDLGITEAATAGATPTSSGAENTASASAGASGVSSATPAFTGAAVAMKPVGGLVAGLMGAAILL